MGLLASFSITGNEGKTARASEEMSHFLLVRIRSITTVVVEEKNTREN